MKRIENLQTDPPICGSMIYDKTGIEYQWGKGCIQLSVYGAEAIECPYEKDGKWILT